MSFFGLVSPEDMAKEFLLLLPPFFETIRPHLASVFQKVALKTGDKMLLDLDVEGDLFTESKPSAVEDAQLPPLGEVSDESQCSSKEDTLHLSKKSVSKDEEESKKKTKKSIKAKKTCSSLSGSCLVTKTKKPKKTSSCSSSGTAAGESTKSPSKPSPDEVSAATKAPLDPVVSGYTKVASEHLGTVDLSTKKAPPVATSASDHGGPTALPSSSSNKDSKKRSHQQDPSLDGEKPPKKQRTSSSGSSSCLSASAVGSHRSGSVGNGAADDIESHNRNVFVDMSCPEVKPFMKCIQDIFPWAVLEKGIGYAVEWAVAHSISVAATGCNDREEWTKKQIEEAICERYGNVDPSILAVGSLFGLVLRCGSKVPGDSKPMMFSTLSFEESYQALSQLSKLKTPQGECFGYRNAEMEAKEVAALIEKKKNRKKRI